MPLDFTQNYLLWDNREDVTFVSVSRRFERSYELVDCKKRQLTFRELAPSGGVYITQDRAWLLPVAILPDGLTPKIADRLIDQQTNEWTVISAELNTWSTWYKLTTRNLTLVYGLRDTLSIWRPETRADRTGSKTGEYKPVLLNMAARFQPTEEVVEDRLGKRQKTQQFTCWTARDIDVQAYDQVRDQDGQIYTCLSSRSANTIDTLQEHTLEIVQ